MTRPLQYLSWTNTIMMTQEQHQYGISDTPTTHTVTGCTLLTKIATVSWWLSFRAKYGMALKKTTTVCDNLVAAVCFL